MLRTRIGDDVSTDAILGHSAQATRLDDQSYWAWHDLTLMHYEVVQHGEQQEEKREEEQHMVASVEAFCKSLAVQVPVEEKEKSKASKLQDILRLLHLWFNYGHLAAVGAALRRGFDTLSVDTWLEVIPQIIARLQTARDTIAALIEVLLMKVGHVHPQALVYALAMSSSIENGGTTKAVLASMVHSPLLVQQALLVSHELIRSAILWDEMWYEALEEASRTYFGNKDTQTMFATLEPLHAIMSAEGGHTFNELSFAQKYGRDLCEAHEWCQRYKATGNASDLNQAGDKLQQGRGQGARAQG